MLIIALLKSNGSSKVLKNVISIGLTK